MAASLPRETFPRESFRVRGGGLIVSRLSCSGRRQYIFAMSRTPRALIDASLFDDENEDIIPCELRP